LSTKTFECIFGVVVVVAAAAAAAAAVAVVDMVQRSLITENYRQELEDAIEHKTRKKKRISYHCETSLREGDIGGRS
jgi:beta-lactam-binding protein with PASTA domain